MIVHVFIDASDWLSMTQPKPHMWKPWIVFRTTKDIDYEITQFVIDFTFSADLTFVLNNDKKGKRRKR